MRFHHLDSREDFRFLIVVEHIPRSSAGFIGIGYKAVGTTAVVRRVQRLANAAFKDSGWKGLNLSPERDQRVVRRHAPRDH